MRVVLNQLPASGLKTGIGHYTAQLVRHLRRQAGSYQIDTFPRRWIHHARRAWEQVRPYLETRRGSVAPAAAAASDTTGVRLRGSMLSVLRQCGRAMLENDFAALCAARRYHVYHEPNFIAMASSLPTFATLHDLSVLLHPEWHPTDRVLHFERHFERSLRRCVHFFAISEFGRQEIIRTLHIPAHRVTRTYMGVRENLRSVPRDRVNAVLRRCRLPRDYLLYLGTIEPRKNLLMLLQAYSSLPREVRERWPLVLVGSWGWCTEKVAEYYHAHARHRGVLHRPSVADADVAAL